MVDSSFSASPILASLTMVPWSGSAAEPWCSRTRTMVMQQNQNHGVAEPEPWLCSITMVLLVPEPSWLMVLLLQNHHCSAAAEPAEPEPWFCWFCHTFATQTGTCSFG
ncbi:uncharacterized protein G2W53_004140 [Senna tora]|uniref:Uncharacterized protein n=1 Tax=Senna tora TaxID=362788 RepID=A0A834XBT7_9FABA|nr:uncharacterized protein G2W53_004140 [Senna tora]